jgi:hypothetical protein
MKHRHLPLLALALLIICSSNPVRAIPVQITATGIVTHVDSILSGRFSVGNAFSVSTSYNWFPAKTGDPAGFNTVIFNTGSLGTYTIGGSNGQFLHTLGYLANNNFSGNDYFRLIANASGMYRGPQVQVPLDLHPGAFDTLFPHGLDIVFGNTNGTAWDSLDIPSTFSNDWFTDGGFDLYFESGRVQSGHVRGTFNLSIQPVVPEPATLGLFVTGLGLMLARLRKQTA